MSEPRRVNAETLFYLVRRISNQAFCRYWLDAKGDGSYSHVAIVVLDDFSERLTKELAEYGFDHSFDCHSVYVNGDASGKVLRTIACAVRYEALRDMETKGVIHPKSMGQRAREYASGGGLNGAAEALARNAEEMERLARSGAELPRTEE